MFCDYCHILMHTIEESGERSEGYHRTEQMFRCEKCGREVRQTYEARVVDETITE